MSSLHDDVYYSGPVPICAREEGREPGNKTTVLANSSNTKGEIPIIHVIKQLK